MFSKYDRPHAALMLLAVLVVSDHLYAGISSRIRSGRSRSHAYENSTWIVETLLKDYDRRIRPGVKGSPAEVRVDMYVANIWAMEEVKMDFTIDIYLRQYWRDERLAFAHLTTDPVLTLSSNINKQIWIPSTYFLSTKKAYFHDVTTENYLLQIRPNGSIFYSVRLTITTSCKLDLRRFPHDTQKCTLALESCNHSSLIATFKMRRRIGYFLIDTYVPSTIIVIISWISFWINPDTAPARVALGITTVLTMTTLISSARASLPKVSYVKAIDWYLLLCLIFVFGSILEYTFVAYILNIRNKSKRKSLPEREWSSCSKEERRESEELPSLFGSKCSPRRVSTLRKVFYKTGDESPETEVKSLSEKVEEKPWYLISDPLTIDKCSRIGFPLTFFAFNCIYWLVHGKE